MSTHSHTLTYTHVTTVKTPLNHTHTMSLIEIIRTVLYYILYAGITIPIILLLLSSVIRDTRELKQWASQCASKRHIGERGSLPDAEK